MSDPTLPGFEPGPEPGPEPEDPPASLVGGLRRLFSSSKYLLVLLSVVGVIVMNLAGRVTGEMALGAIGALISVAVGATAYEDAASKKVRNP